MQKHLSADQWSDDAAVFTHFSQINTEFVLCDLAKDPSGDTEFPPAAILGEEAPSDGNQTHNPASGCVRRESKAHVREA